MSFGNLPAAWSLLGLAAIAGILYMLQRLRVRHQLVEVETTMFWRQAIEESRARVLVQRFRHPWAYLLILLIAGLLWFSVAGLRTNASGQRDHLVLLDGSAAMAQSFDEVVELATSYASSLPEDARTVVLCGGRARTLLRPGEESLLLSRRLADVSPDAAPNSVARTLRSFVVAQADRALSVCIVGGSTLTAEELALLPESVEVRQLKVRKVAAHDAGIKGLGVRAAASGKWHCVDVLVNVDGPMVPDQQPGLSLDGVAWTGSPAVTSLADGSSYRFVDVPAHGQLLEATIAGEDGSPANAKALLMLPDRRPIAVAVEPSVAAVFRRVIASDPGLSLRESVTAETRVAIRSVGSTFGGDVPAIELSDPAASEDAFLVFHPEELDPGAVIDELYAGLGLNEIDAMATAKAIGRAITMGAKPGATKKLWLWRQLLEPEYDFVNSRSFPLFVGLGVRWLVGFEEGPERVAVSEPFALRDADVQPVQAPRVQDASLQRSFTNSFVPTSPGVFQTSRGNRFAASLLAPGTTGAAAAALPPASVASASGYDLVTALLLLALGLLVAEWVLYRTARIP